MQLSELECSRLRQTLEIFLQSEINYLHYFVLLLQENVTYSLYANNKNGFLTVLEVESLTIQMPTKVAWGECPACFYSVIMNMLYLEVF